MADKELTEISKKTLKSYLDKAWASYNKNEKLSNLSLKMNDGEKSDLHTRIADKRYRNFHKAINKIAKIKESSELEEKAPPLTRFQKLKKAVHNSTKDLPGGPMTKAATLAGIEGAAAGAGYAIWGLPGAAISGTYGLYQGYKALKGAYDSIKEDVSDEDIISSMLTLYEIRVKYEDIKEDLEDKDFQLFLDEGFDTDEIADFFSSDPEEWDPLFESIDQLDEISKKTLGNYLTYKEIRHRYDDKDHYDAQQKRDRAYQAVNNARNDAYSDLTQDQKDSLWSASNKISNEKHAAEKKFERKAKNSYHGTINAVNRLQGKFAGKKIIDEPEVRSPKKGYLTKPEKSHIEYKDYKAESVELEESDLNNRSRKIFMNPKMANIPLEGNVAGIGNKGDNAKIKKQMKEDTEINEISKKTLGSYINKASSSRVKLQKRYSEIDKDHDAINHATGTTYNVRDENARNAIYDMRKALSKDYIKQTDDIGLKDDNRRAGIKRAVSRLTKEDTEINEISKKTLGSYINKAATNMAGNWGDHERNQADYEHRWDQLNRQDHNAPHEVKKALNDTKNTLTKSYNKKQSALSHKAVSRQVGIGRAVDRMQSNFSSVKVDKTDSNGDIIKVPKKYNEDIDYKVELESIVRSSLEGDASDIKGRFESLLQDKISDVLDAQKDEIALNLFDKIDEPIEANESEMVNEISKKVLGSYINRALNDVRKSNQAIGRRDRGAPWESSENLGLSDQEAKYHIKNKRVAQNREKGIKRAVDRMQGDFSTVKVAKPYFALKKIGL